MDSQKCDTSGMAKDDGLPCYNYGQVGHISHNCPNRDLINMPLKQALVNKDAPKHKSGHPRKNKKMGGGPTGLKVSRQLAEEKEVKRETDSETERKLENLSDFHSEAGIVKEGQYLWLYIS
jgi:hypothetical protein